MQPTNRFSRIAAIGYLTYFLIEVIIFPLITKVPPVLSNILSTIYVASFIVVAAWIISLDSTLKKPAIFIIIAAVFGLANRIFFLFYMTDNPSMNAMTYSLITTTLYLPHLIFTCIGFFKLAKGLPKGNLARYMAKLIPWTALAPLIISLAFTFIMLVTTIPNTILRWTNTVMSLAEILMMALFCYSLPKAIEKKESL